MKKYALIILLIIYNHAIAQQFKTSVIISPGISWYISNSADLSSFNKSNSYKEFCFSGAIKEEFYFPKIFSFGIEVNYLHSLGFIAYQMDNLVMDLFYFRDKLSINSLNIPLLLKLRTNTDKNKGIYFYFGTGISYIIYTSINDDSQTNRDATLKNQNNYDFGKIGLLGIGKSFKIKKKTFFCEARYNFDLNKWVYPIFNGMYYININLQRECLLLNLGYTF